MVKKPDLSDLTSKFDLDKILGGIKSMINPEGATPDVDPSDALGLKIAQLSALFQEMAKSHAQLSKDFGKANELLNVLFNDLQAVRDSSQKRKAGPKTQASIVTPTSTKTAEPKSSEDKPPEEHKD